MAWTNIANANLQVGAPLRSVDILALRDNVSAVPNGDSGAPRIKAAALDGGQSGAAPIYAARAWVNFNGSGTVAIRASGNVSSITDNGTGNYTVIFNTAMPDVNYCVVNGYGQPLQRTVSLFRTSASNSARLNPTTTSFRVIVAQDTTSPTDPDDLHLAVFR
jgi:hypothetical protein